MNDKNDVGFIYYGCDNIQMANILIGGGDYRRWGNIIDNDDIDIL